MPTKAQMQEEIDNLRNRLYQERQDQSAYVKFIRETAYNVAKEHAQVKQVLCRRSDVDVVLPIINAIYGSDGVTLVVGGL